MSEVGKGFDIIRVMELLPHRHPFLLIDRVLSWEPNASLRAVKNISISEPYFPGHFPGRPVMPGVILLEAMAQAATLLARLSLQASGSDLSSSYSYLVGIEQARFRRPIIPGDRLILDVSFLGRRHGYVRLSSIVRVEDKKVANADFMLNESRFAMGDD